MKLALPLALVILLTGCLAETLVSTATEAEASAEAAQVGMKALDYSKGIVNNSQIVNAIKIYEAEMGEFPATLDVLVPSYLPALPTKSDGTAYTYNAQTGQVY